MRDGIPALAADNLLSPIIPVFFPGVGATFARSDLSVPAILAKGLSIYLLLAIGSKGGTSVATHGVDATLGLSLVTGLVLSFAIPLVAFAPLKAMTRLSVTDAAAVAGHYGYIFIVTFVAATSVATSAGMSSESYMVGVAAVMKAPAIAALLPSIYRKPCMTRRCAPQGRTNEVPRKRRGRFRAQTVEGAP